MKKSGPSANKPRSVDELTQRNIDTIARFDEATKIRCSATERVADFITAFCGSVTFVWLHVVWFGGWMAYNTLAATSARFDPFPCPFLTLVVSLEAIFLSTFILISQNRQSKLNERRAHLDLQIDLLAEQENTKMLQLLNQIAGKLGIDLQEDVDARLLSKTTRPEKVLEQIDRRISGSEEVKK